MKTSKEILKRRAKDKRLYNTYGIRVEDWDRMFKEQKGVCWICLILPKSGILCTDHRHAKGFKKMSLEDKAKEVRGLLCFTCNVFLGKLEKRNNARFVLERVVEYANNFKLKGDV